MLSGLSDSIFVTIRLHSRRKVVLNTLQGNKVLPLDEVVLRVTVTQVLYECQVNENLIVQMLRSRCHCTENEAVNLYVYEKTTRAPIRALQSYLEAEKGFPPDSKKSVYGLAFDKMSSEPDCRNVTPGGVLCPLRPGVRGAERGSLLPRHADGNCLGCCDGDLKHDMMYHHYR